MKITKNKPKPITPPVTYTIELTEEEAKAIQKDIGGRLYGRHGQPTHDLWDKLDDAIKGIAS